MPPIPQHVAIIMDGNRRWAKRRGLSVSAGHREGYETLERIADHCLKLGIKFLTVYAFSTENWRRPKREVLTLMNLIRLILKRRLKEFLQKGIQLKVLGRIVDFPKDVQYLLRDAIASSRRNTRCVFNIALNYGGRTELVDAVRKMVRQGVAPRDVSEATIQSNLYTAGEPDPDLVIRTSGEQRLSNYLLWQTAYSELIFSPKLWPDFQPADLDAAIAEFNRRKRNFGR